MLNSDFAFLIHSFAHAYTARICAIIYVGAEIIPNCAYYTRTLVLCGILPYIASTEAKESDSTRL